MTTKKQLQQRIETLRQQRDKLIDEHRKELVAAQKEVDARDALIRQLFKLVPALSPLTKTVSDRYRRVLYSHCTDDEIVLGEPTLAEDGYADYPVVDQRLIAELIERREAAAAEEQEAAEAKEAERRLTDIEKRLAADLETTFSFAAIPPQTLTLNGFDLGVYRILTGQEPPRTPEERLTDTLEELNTAVSELAATIEEQA